MKHVPLAKLQLSERFTLSLVGRTLFKDGEPVKIGTRALEILIVLAESAGKLVAKTELLDRVWPNQQIDEAALRVHLSTLRRLLEADGDERRLIVNENGRGYRLTIDECHEASGEPQEAQSRRHVAPVPVASLVGRETLSQHCAELLANRRLVSLTGAGGVGKSVLAYELAPRFAALYQANTIVLDVAGFTLAEEMLKALAIRLAGPEAACPYRTVLDAARDRPLLVVLDGCEEAIDAAASVAGRLVQISSQVFVLATSQEPLRIAGEWVVRVPPLPVPDTPFRSVEVLGQSPAVRLFLERARAAGCDLDETPDTLTTVALICRQMEGLPLAIEMAAAMLLSRSLDDLCRDLQAPLAVLVSHRRDLPDRHRSLLATVDRSIGRLRPDDRSLLRRLSFLDHSFAMKDALRLATCFGLSADQVADGVLRLTACSLLSADTSHPVTRYSVSNLLKAYARRGRETHQALIPDRHPVGPHFAEVGTARGPLYMLQAPAIDHVGGRRSGTNLPAAFAHLSSRRVPEDPFRYWVEPLPVVGRQLDGLLVAASFVDPSEAEPGLASRVPLTRS